MWKAIFDSFWLLIAFLNTPSYLEEHIFEIFGNLGQIQTKFSPQVNPGRHPDKKPQNVSGQVCASAELGSRGVIVGPAEAMVKSRSPGFVSQNHSTQKYGGK
jgi:hypothetical protein